MKLFKKAVCCIVAAATFAASAAGICIVYADTAASANIAMLESIINGSRGYVADTLINDNLSTNPQAKVSYISEQKSMMSDVLSRYSNKDDPNYNMLYTAAVDLMFAVYNIDDWATEVANTVTELGADAVESFGGEAVVSALLSECVQSSKSQRLDSILQEVISADYTSSSGVSINDNDAQLTNIRRISDAVGALDALNRHLKSLTGLDQETADSTAAYLNDVLIPVADSYEDAVRSFGDMVGAQAGTMDEAIFELSKALAVAAMYETNVISEETAGGVITEIAPSYLLDDTTIGLIDLASNITKFASSSIDTYTYIKSIQTQKDTLAGPLKRAASYIGEGDSAEVLNKYARLIESAGDEKTAQYEWVIQTLKNKGVVENFTKKQVKKGLTTLRDRLMPLYNESIIPSKISALTGVISVTHAVADKVTNIKGTILKTYELKETSALMNCFIQAYYDDLAAYYSNKTEENAKNVLDDLAFIQRIRLRGETVAYRMIRDQLSAPLGQLLSGGCDSLEYYDQNYQDHIDALIAASVCPVTDKELTVASGTTLEINYNEDYGGLYGVLTDSSGNRHGIAEISMRAVNGINVQSGGTLKLYVSLNDVTIPYIIGSGGNIEWYMPQFKVADLEMSGGKLKLSNHDYNADVVSIKNAGFETGSSNLICGDLNINNVSGGNLNIYVNGECAAYNNLSNVTLYMNNSDILCSSASIGCLVMNSKTPQSIQGSCSAAELINRNTSKKGITVENAITVNSIRNMSGIINNSGNITLDGYFPENYYNGDIKIKSITGNMPDISGTVTFIEDAEINNSFSANNIKNDSIKLTINNNAELTGTLSVNSGEVEFNNSDSAVNGAISLTKGKITLNNSDLTVKSFMNIDSSSQLSVLDNSRMTVQGDVLNKGTLVCDGRLTLCGDFVNSGSCKINELYVSGRMPQYYSGKDIYLNSVYFNGYGNVYISNKIYCSNNYYNLSGIDLDYENIIIQRAGEITDDITYLDDLYLDSNFAISGADVIVNGDLTMSSGNISVEDGGSLMVKGRLNMNGSSQTITSGDGSVITVNKYAVLGSLSALTADGTIIFANDTVLDSGEVSGDGTLELRCDFYAPNVSVSGLKRIDITGKTPQEITCSSIKCGELNIDNNSKRGVSFKNNVYYSESYTPHDSVVTGNITQEVQ